jgi:hypothetical protein
LRSRTPVTQWVDSFQGKGWSNTVSVAAYGSFTQSAFYVDALAGYAYSNNQMQRQISLSDFEHQPGSVQRVGRQLLEPERRAADDDVVRTTLGADLAGAIGLGDTRTLDLGLRLGWLHEYANTAGPSPRLPGQHQRGRRDATLPALRRPSRLHCLHSKSTLPTATSPTSGRQLS